MTVASYLGRCQCKAIKLLEFGKNGRTGAGKFTGTCLGTVMLDRMYA